MRERKEGKSQRRRSVNLTIPEDVMAAARSLGVNASRAAEAGVRQAIEERLAERWLKENAAALNAHNARVERDGTLLSAEWTQD